MPAGPVDSLLCGRIPGDEDTARLSTDSAEIRAMLVVEGTLARVQGLLGVIPADVAALVDRASKEVEIDPVALADETALNGVPVPARLAAFRKASGTPELMPYVRWGAASQDIAVVAAWG
jgi:3-carboxy-cis,cis-muconate cycloisomerase